MRTEPEIREAMIRLLGPVSPTWVADQVGVTRQQVDRWKNGRYVSAERLAQVAEAVRSLLPEHQETPRPKWAEGMERRILNELQTIREEPYTALADAAAERALRLAGLLPDEPSDGTPGQQQGGAGPSKGPTV